MVARTRAKVLAELQAGPATAADLASRVHSCQRNVQCVMRALRKDQLVLWDMQRTAGRPARVYRLAS